MYALSPVSHGQIVRLNQVLVNLQFIEAAWTFPSQVTVHITRLFSAPLLRG